MKLLIIIEKALESLIYILKEYLETELEQTYYED